MTGKNCAQDERDLEVAGASARAALASRSATFDMVLGVGVLVGVSLRFLRVLDLPGDDFGQKLLWGLALLFGKVFKCLNGGGFECVGRNDV